jgi:5-(carboxyamino)imidazole ribonucleotide mutase
LSHQGELKFTTAGDLLKPEIAIVMGSISDWSIMAKAAEILDDFKISYHKEILSAHRTPKRTVEFAENAVSNGYSVIIAGAGGAAHLPGIIAANTTLPVIGVPVNATPLNGMDALLAIVQMPKGIPVATVAVDGAMNAGLLALQILGTHDTGIAHRLAEYKAEMIKRVDDMNNQGFNG